MKKLFLVALLLVSPVFAAESAPSLRELELELENVRLKLAVLDVSQKRAEAQQEAAQNMMGIVAQRIPIFQAHEKELLKKIEEAKKAQAEKK